MKTYKYSLGIIFLLLIAGCETNDLSHYQANSKILFISQRIENTGDWNLFSMNDDGTEQIKITDLTVRCEKPVVSHNGKSVLFVHYTANFLYKLCSIATDGTNLTLIDSAKRYCGSANWSMDDTKIIYSKNRDDLTDNKDLILFDISTGHKVILKSTGNNISAKFSSNNRIAFCRQNDISSDIYTMNMNGSNEQLMIAKASCPVWSPNGKKIAYISKGYMGSPQIFVANFDGSDPKQLTKNYLPCWDSGFPTFGNYNPQWTPNGNKIVYESEINDGLPEIYIMNNDGSNQKRLTETDRRNESPVLSSDGKSIIFSSNRDLNYNADIYIMNIDGKNQYPLSKYYGNDCFPVLMNK